MYSIAEIEDRHDRKAPNLSLEAAALNTFAPQSSFPEHNKKLPTTTEHTDDSTMNSTTLSEQRMERPEAVRRLSDTPPSTMLQQHFAVARPPPAPHSRTRSPFSRSHLRSRSSGSAMNAPLMIRAHSMPAVNYARGEASSSLSSGLPSPGLRSQSPQRSPGRVRSPLASEFVDNSYFPRSPRWTETAPIVAIQEDSELDLSRDSASFSSPLPPSAAVSNRPTSSRRRPASPLYSVAASPASTPTAHADGMTANSPALAPVKYNEAFPSQFSLHHYPSTSSFSSISSSTPSSARSRSPSISSLDTIEDAPDAESEALEADRLWRLKLAADKAERGDDSGDEAPRRKGFGFGRGRNNERKRWSVCGGERRADLDLETIWED